MQEIQARMTAGFGLANGRGQQSTSHHPCTHVSTSWPAEHVKLHDETLTAVLGGCVPLDR